MSTRIVEDRVLARIAFEAVGWNPAVTGAELADVALGQAVVALRVMGIAATPEIVRTVRADIALVLADAAAVARARALGPRPVRARPANTNQPAPLRVVAV